MKCIYCGKAAVGIDLCHASHPVCENEHAFGHQLGPLPEPKRQAKASTATAKADAPK